MIVEPIAHIENDFPGKFGLPRQSGLNPALLSRIVPEKRCAGEEFTRGIEEFSHLWLIWGFDVPARAKASVRPPRLGGNVKRGVFATRSPFRPNPLGLTVVKLEGVERSARGTVLTVSGADMKSGTPIYDIKPYLPYADSVPDACGGFGEAHAGDTLEVEFPPDIKQRVPEDKLEALMYALAQDPRPAYHADPERIYGFYYADMDVRFRVSQNVLTVVQIVNRK
ncbi:MAG: tRNA (N6-threonylcarbamoyladenosine(37)-N6)-methyltransferase TrmO [Clostridia bacterium]|nr:tRNA (N6-threonylcarbamoyladenosine(37)-N6)-methyltransferase TrmO [Clostridia bacterium]